MDRGHRLWSYPKHNRISKETLPKSKGFEKHCVCQPLQHFNIPGLFHSLRFSHAHKNHYFHRGGLYMCVYFFKLESQLTDSMEKGMIKGTHRTRTTGQNCTQTNCEDACALNSKIAIETVANAATHTLRTLHLLISFCQD